MLRQATIPGVRNDKAVTLTVMHDDDEEDGLLVKFSVNGGQPVEVQAAELRESIADVLPKGEV